MGMWKFEKRRICKSKFEETRRRVLRTGTERLNSHIQHRKRRAPSADSQEKTNSPASRERVSATELYHLGATFDKLRRTRMSEAIFWLSPFSILARFFRGPHQMSGTTQIRRLVWLGRIRTPSARPSQKNKFPVCAYPRLFFPIDIASREAFR